MSVWMPACGDMGRTMKIIETAYRCKCGEIRSVQWFASEMGNIIGVTSEIRCLKCSAEIDMTATVKFNVNDIEGYLVVWDEVLE